MARKTKKQRDQESKAYLSSLKDLEKRIKGHIKDNYPQVNSIIFEMKYKDPDFLCTPEPKTYKRKSDDYAYFKFDCPFIECIDGGYDLDLVVYSMMENHETEKEGMLKCQGWQDAERINKNRCLCELDYKIMIEYT